MRRSRRRTATAPRLLRRTSGRASRRAPGGRARRGPGPMWLRLRGPAHPASRGPPPARSRRSRACLRCARRRSRRHEGSACRVGRGKARGARRRTGASGKRRVERRSIAAQGPVARGDAGPPRRARGARRGQYRPVTRIIDVSHATHDMQHAAHSIKHDMQKTSYSTPCIEKRVQRSGSLCGRNGGPIDLLRYVVGKLLASFDSHRPRWSAGEERVPASQACRMRQPRTV